MRASIKLIAAILLTASIASAQAKPIRNDTPSNLRELASDLNVGTNFSVDQKGQVKVGTVSPGTATTNLGKARAGTPAAGDVGVIAFGIRSDNRNVMNTDEKYGTFSVDASGGVYLASQTYGPAIGEDTAISGGDNMVKIGVVTSDPLTVEQAGTNRWAYLKVDRAGRTITTLAPAGETFYACGTATASTSDVAIKAAVASNRIYVTSITCKNTSATVASSLDFKDGTTVMAVGGVSHMATASDGSFMATFPVPLRGTVNTALNFATNVSVSSVTCCAAGYVSVS